jgi:GNAT superfamily N-acetyltransferase
MTLRLAEREDVSRLVAFMTEFYGESGYSVNQTRAAEAFSILIANERLGYVWLIEAAGQDVGYVVLTLGYSMEYGGRDGFIDDLFVQAAYRNGGLGSATLSEVCSFAERLGVRALHLEVGRDNAAAHTVYRRAGFMDTERQLLTLRLADPSHAV